MYNLLKGLRVIDLTTIVLGPYASQILGDLGGDIIKVEPLEGDLFRAVRPGRSAQMGAGFLNFNRNKKSIAVDLKSPEGQEVLHKLIGGADALVHNMRPKSAAKLGFSYEACAKLKADLVYCFSAGFGQTGPYADMPAYDDIIQAMSGVAYLNATAAGEPRFLRTIIADKVGGLFLAMAVLGGIVRRQATGQGCCVEAPMFESMASFLMGEQLSGQTFEPPLGGIGYDRLLSPNRRPYPTVDGYVTIMPYTSVHWQAFLEFIGRTDIAREKWVTDSVQRSEKVDQLYQIIAEVTPTRSTNEWLEALTSRGVPCAPVNRLSDLFADPHLAAVGMFENMVHPTEGAIRSVRTPFTIEGEPSEPDQPAPSHGQHTRQILSEAGMTDSRIEELMERGIIK